MKVVHDNHLSKNAQGTLTPILLKTKISQLEISLTHLNQIPNYPLEPINPNQPKITQTKPNHFGSHPSSLERVDLSQNPAFGLWTKGPSLGTNGLNHLESLSPMLSQLIKQPSHAQLIAQSSSSMPPQPFQPLPCPGQPPQPPEQYSPSPFTQPKIQNSTLAVSNHLRAHLSCSALTLSRLLEPSPWPELLSSALPIRWHLHGHGKVLKFFSTNCSQTLLNYSPNQVKKNPTAFSH